MYTDGRRCYSSLTVASDAVRQCVLGSGKPCEVSLSRSRRGPRFFSACFFPGRKFQNTCDRSDRGRLSCHREETSGAARPSGRHARRSEPDEVRTPPRHRPMARRHPAAPRGCEVRHGRGRTGTVPMTGSRRRTGDARRGTACGLRERERHGSSTTGPAPGIRPRSGKRRSGCTSADAWTRPGSSHDCRPPHHERSPRRLSPGSSGDLLPKPKTLYPSRPR